MREIIQTEKAPKAIGPYSQAIKSKGWIYVSGQIALNSQGQLISGGIQDQTRLVLQNLSNILQAAGSSLEQVVKSSIFMVDLKDFGTMNDIYAEFFGKILPARETVQAAALPRGALIEISVIAQSEK
ncbi:MAG: Rid family detoxifying hydrolase [Planctomycetota bacterium]